jgi:MoxR-like ATPase
MSISDDLSQAISKFESDREVAEFVKHNLQYFYNAHCSRIIANRHEVNFDMREDHWRLPEACIFLGYAIENFYQKFSPVIAVRAYLLQLSSNLRDARERNLLNPYLRNFWRDVQPGQVTELAQAITRIAQTWDMKSQDVEILPFRKDLEQSGGLVKHFCRFVEEIGQKDTAQDDLRTDLFRRIQFLPYLKAKTEAEWQNMTYFFTAWYNLMTSTNAYNVGGAQAFGPFLGNNSCNRFLQLVNSWYEGKRIDETPFLAYGSSGDNQSDISQYTPMTELYGYISLNRRPFFNKKTRTYYAKALGDFDSSPSDLNEITAHEIRKILEREPRLTMQLRQYWHEGKSYSKDATHLKGNKIESCSLKGLLPFHNESDRIIHAIRKLYSETFSTMDLGYSDLDMAAAMSHLILDAYYYQQTKAPGTAVVNRSDSPESPEESQDETGFPSSTSPEADGPRLWLLGTGGGGFMWPTFRDQDFIAIGMNDFGLGDLTEYQTKESLNDLMIRFSKTGNSPVNDVLCAWEFGSEIKIGDYVIAKQGRSVVYGLGKIIGPYEYDRNSAEYKHKRRVQWLKIGHWTLPENLKMVTKTLTYVGKYPEYARSLLHAINADNLEDGQIENQVEESYARYSRQNALEEIFLSGDQLEKIIYTLRSKKNIVLQGPPGVGKTFLAKRIAYSMMEEKNPDRVLMVQFHQSFAYEDFIQGIRPNESGVFTRQNRSFYNLCRLALADPNHDYFCIIDEINRGNLSKIFGELLMLIEEDKRSPEYEVVLTYAHNNDEKFFIPSNFYIIGLMNTADRSLAPIDIALRRRFRFINIEPAFETPQFRNFLRSKGAKDELIQLIIDQVIELNSLIASDRKNLGPGFQIGHSYFCPTKQETPDTTWLQDILQMEVVELLKEYWYDNEKMLETALKILKVG